MPVLSGQKWGAAPLGTPGGVVTWSLAPAGEDLSEFLDGPVPSVDPSTVLSADVETVIRNAFADWSAQGDIEFVQLSDPGGAAGDVLTPDIRIFFGPIPGNTLGFGFFPSNFPIPIAGDILFDVDPDLDRDASLLEGLVLHEIGHALGLDHIFSVPAIMNTPLSASTLLDDDIDGITQIYGVQDASPETYDMRAGARALTLIHNPERLTINGNALGNTITATAANETINGLAGDDTLEGGAGDDVLDGGIGNDTAVWRSVTRSEAEITRTDTGLLVTTALGVAELRNIETLEFSDQNVGVAALIDSIYGSPGNIVEGVTGDDSLLGTAANDTLRGLDGDDTLSGAAGNDLLDGGDGSDVIAASDGRDTVDGGGGADSIGGGTGDDIIDGGAGNDVIGAGQGNDRANGGADNDMVNGGAGDDTLGGDLGNDSMGGSFGNDEVSGGLGDDDIGGGEGRDTIDAGAGDDSVGGGEGDDVILGGDGADFLAGGGRNDEIDGGDGNDSINGGDGDDMMTGGTGADVFVFNFFKDGDADVITDYEDGTDSFLIRTVNPDTGEINISNGGQGIQGFVDALGITDTVGGAQMNIGGHLVLVEGIAAADLTVDDFLFL